MVVVEEEEEEEEEDDTKAELGSPFVFLVSKFPSSIGM